MQNSPLTNHSFSYPRRLAVVCLLFLFCLTRLSAQTLRLYHIDVEQAAATLVISPAGHTLLIDSGKNGHGARIKAVMDRAGVTRIDHFVDTHYHEDHYGGIDELINNFSVVVDKAYDRGDKDELSPSDRDDESFKGYETAIGHRAQQLARGQTIPLDPAMTVTCVASGGSVLGEVNPTHGNDENDKSVALEIEFGDFRFFIGGDIEQTTEGKLAARDLVMDGLQFDLFGA